MLGLDEVVAVDQIDDTDEFRVECASQAETGNQLLSSVLQLGIRIEGFQKDLRHLNEAFMDLTEQGVR